MPKLIIADMKHGQQADGGIRDDALQSFRRLVNYDLIFGGEHPRLRVRKGFERWNAVALPAVASQLHPFVDMDENFHLLIRCNSLWYEANSAGAHTQLSTYAAATRKPVVQFGNRVFLGTAGSHADDPGMIWTSDVELAGVPYSYRLGIKRPDGQITLTTIAAPGNIANIDLEIRVSASARRKVAIKYVVGAEDEIISSIAILVHMDIVTNPQPGSWKCKIYTDDAGEPSSTLLNNDAISGERPVALFSPTASAYKNFHFQDFITLTAGDTVWFVLEPDSEYYNSYNPNPAPDTFFGTVSMSAAPHVHGETLQWNGNTNNWDGSTGEAIFYFSGLAEGVAYGYVCTYYNSVHNIESRPSDEIRSEISSGRIFRITNYPLTTDPQIDQIRVYRREMSAIDDIEDDITDPYKFVGEYDIGHIFDDGYSSESLKGELQTEDHYCLDESAGEGKEGRQEVIIPSCACWWKGRLIVGRLGSNKLAMSKVFEQTGASGLLGTSAPDFFPLRNEIDIPEPAYPIDIYPLSNDQLVVYMSNETTYIVFGGDQSLNPPADFAIAPISQTHGLIGMGSFTPMVSKHVYMTRDGIWSIEGAGTPSPVYESEMNGSIIKAVENVNLKNTRMITYGNEVWALLDWDNDGDLDTVLILNLEREVLSRGLYGRNWKMYQYPVSLTGLSVINTGDEFRQILAGDADNNYILELNTGTLDNGAAITAWCESHDLKAENLPMINQLDIDTFFADENNRPTYTYTLTDNAGNTVSGTMAPLSNEDVRGHGTGVRMKRPVSVRAMLSQVSTKADDLRAIVIGYTGE